MFFLLRYAFVYHRTSKDATYNLQRPKDFKSLGPECHIEYANGRSMVVNNDQHINRRKLVINRIPLNITENDLRRMFANCRVLKYCPAYITKSASKMLDKQDKRKILPGYEECAFLTIKCTVKATFFSPESTSDNSW